MENNTSLIGKKIKGFKFDPHPLFKHENTMNDFIGKIGIVVDESICDNWVVVRFSKGKMGGYPRDEAFKYLVEETTENESVKYEGEIKGIKQEEPFYMVVVEGDYTPSTIKYSDYQEAFEEMLRLSTHENETAYVVKVVVECKQVTQITKFD